MRRLASTAGPFFVVLLLLSGKAQAVPLLQLDMLGGVYDPITQTIVAPGGPFTLFAVLTPRGGDDVSALLEMDYYVSVALMPGATDPASLGSFTINGTTYATTGDMGYGTPPIDAVQTSDPGDLPSHGLFETYFVQVPIHFSALDTALTYDTAESPGGLVADPSGGSYFVALVGDSSLLASGYNLHFDLYDTKVAKCHSIGTCHDIDVDHFAPFSHDASTVPDPASTATLLLLGLGGIGAFSRRRV